MVRVIFAPEMRLQTAGVQEAEVTALSYRALVRELGVQFPQLTKSEMDKYSVAIDGVMVRKPLLETFADGSEVVFIPRIAGG